MRKSVWLLSAGLAAISCPAFAQDNQSTPQPTDPSPTEQAGTTDAAQEAAAEAQKNAQSGSSKSRGPEPPKKSKSRR